MMVEVKQDSEVTQGIEVITTLLQECSAIADYRTLRDSLPRRLTGLLRCRCVLLYQRVGATLQFAAGTFDDQPGWSASLLAVARINPIELDEDVPEACAWRERRAVLWPTIHPSGIALPLLYRQRAIGVLVALRGRPSSPSCWQSNELPYLNAVAGIVALLLENTRLLEHDRERIQELLLLNSVSKQMNYALYDEERIQTMVVQRTREISGAEWCILIDSQTEAVTGDAKWFPPALRSLLLRQYREQHLFAPLIIERPGDHHNAWVTECLSQLAPQVKTLFLLPVVGGRYDGREHDALVHPLSEGPLEPRLHGLVVGAYHYARKLRQEEQMVLQVLVSQAGAVLENIRLMAEVVEARNEARRLLRQVLDDRRLKELIVQSIPSGLITTDRYGNITTCNRAAEEILGYEAREVIGQPLHRLLDARRITGAASFALDAPIEQEALVVRRGEVSHVTLEAQTHDGQPLMLDVTAQPLYGEHARQEGCLVTFSDVTSVHRLEEEKRRLDRLASLGEMAASVAHEVRNPLASIKTSIQMAMDDLAATLPPTSFQGSDEAQTEQERVQEIKESMTIVLQEVERLDTIVRDLLLFARPRRLHRRACDLAVLCEHVLHIVQSQCEQAGITVQRIYEEIPEVWVDVAQIEQVLLNLCMNAVQAMERGGTLTVICHRYTVDETCRSMRRGQIWVELVVRDTGCGIAPEQQVRIFQPFFTTKAHGIGLGLPISRRFVEDHGGCLVVASQQGMGSSFAVRLPVLVPREPESRSKNNKNK